MLAGERDETRYWRLAQQMRSADADTRAAAYGEALALAQDTASPTVRGAVASALAARGVRLNTVTEHRQFNTDTAERLDGTD
jgi:hypothetical protein